MGGSGNQARGFELLFQGQSGKRPGKPQIGALRRFRLPAAFRSCFPGKRLSRPPGQNWRGILQESAPLKIASAKRSASAMSRKWSKSSPGSSWISFSNAFRSIPAFFQGRAASYWHREARRIAQGLFLCVWVCFLIEICQKIQHFKFIAAIVVTQHLCIVLKHAFSRYTNRHVSI